MALPIFNRVFRCKDMTYLKLETAAGQYAHNHLVSDDMNSDGLWEYNSEQKNFLTRTVVGLTYDYTQLYIKRNDEKCTLLVVSLNFGSKQLHSLVPGNSRSLVIRKYIVLKEFSKCINKVK